MNQYRLTFVLLIGLIATIAFAQNKISGKLSDHETREVLPYATVRLLQQDSTQHLWQVQLPTRWGITG